ncbi:MAG: YceI family protein [Wenzhouxiangella sp.]|nr:YceI family protein [Wenzhouxiangella sp.]
MPTINAAMKKLSLALLATILLAACQAQPRPSSPDQPRPASDRVLAWPEQGRRFLVNAEASELRIVVYADGPLARFGHPHVIGGAVLTGEVMLTEPFSDSALRLEIDVAAMEVDRPSWRSDEGFDPDMSASAIADTRSNMLSPAVLSAAQFPQIKIESLAISGPTWQPDIELRVHLVGNMRELTVPIALDIGETSLVATGRMLISQRDFGIEPFSAAGGNLAVADELLIRFRVIADAQ